MYQHREISQYNVQHVSSLPGLYGFLGNDYTPAFFGDKPMQIATKKEKFANALVN